jgi:hypothetical protein
LEEEERGEMAAGWKAGATAPRTAGRRVRRVRNDLENMFEGERGYELELKK